ncbi:prephenate dehydrogenase [Desulfofalx alkaliphila]|uniref:prephenate dehydrogenase n=1 Tax=Desulfofalx alkaliphila TaxID=105483 RepID=UPI0004E10F1C|nr:prephenate dehydrogenase [Desulfofalx alkaliphila]
MFQRIAIIGVGLIGGSFGLAVKHRSLAKEVVGLDKDRRNLELALTAGAVHRVASSLEQAVDGADLVVLATPVLTGERLLRQLAPLVEKNTIITDVGSTKHSITVMAEEILPSGLHFVGGHPMTGSEIAGMKGADPYLFENAYYILTPTQKTQSYPLEKVRNLVKAMGARVIELSPKQHDQTVAVVSHLPHLIACALVNTLDETPNSGQMSPLAAGGFRDTTRIAAGNPEMWRDIFHSNRGEVLKAIKRFRATLDSYQRLITDADSEKLQQKLEQARKVRRSLPARSKGYLPALYEVLLTVPDQPGVIAHFSALLGNKGVNITDLEILRVREGQGGTIRLAFATEEEQEEAVKILGEAGYQAHVR